MVGFICSNMSEILDNSGIAVLAFTFDFVFTKLSSLYSILQNLSLSVIF